MGRGELQRHKQPTDLESTRQSFSHIPASYVFVFGVVSLTALAVVAITAAVVAVSVAIVAVALRPYFKR